MKEQQQWAKDKPYLIKILAAQLISTADNLAEEFKSIKLHRFAYAICKINKAPGMGGHNRTPRRMLIPS